MHGESTRSMVHSVKWVADVAYDLNESGKQSLMVKPKEKHNWVTLGQTYPKINVDAAFDDDTRQGGTGLGVHDHDGKLLQAQAIWYEHGLSAMAMESFAIKDGVQLAWIWGIGR